MYAKPGMRRSARRLKPRATITKPPFGRSPRSRMLIILLMFISRRVLLRRALLSTLYSRIATQRRHARKGDEIKRILIIRPDHLGDLLFATPALELLRIAFPQAHITG